MNRRSFLQGTVLAVAAKPATALIQLASPTEIAMVKEGESALLSAPFQPPSQFTWPLVLHNAEGEAVALVSSFHVEARVVDVTSHHDEFRSFMDTGLRDVTFEVEPLPQCIVWFNREFKRMEESEPVARQHRKWLLNRKKQQ